MMNNGHKATTETLERRFVIKLRHLKETSAGDQNTARDSTSPRVFPPAEHEINIKISQLFEDK
jgi:hypothetical protein